MFEFLDYIFFRNALIALTIMAVALSVAGTYIVARRMVFVSGGITHTCFGGLGLGYYLGVSPFFMAWVFAVTGALGARWLERRGIGRNDSSIGVIWALGMAIGIFFVFMSSGYVPELNTFLFGNVLTVNTTDLWVAGIFTFLLCALFFIFSKVIMAVAFDYDFARTRNLPAAVVEVAMMVLIAGAIVMAVRIMGIMLLMSLVTLPQLISELFTRRYIKIVMLSGVVSWIGSVSGLVVAWYTGVPASACIVIILAVMAGGSYLLRNIFWPHLQR